MGRKDISGDDWGDIFAAALNAQHLQSPLGIVDIALGSTAWSAKTVKAANPMNGKTVRLISGRNAPVFSYGNDDPFADVQETGQQVIGIWNARVAEAMQAYSQLRTVVLVRDMVRFRFKVFEQATTQFDPSDYVWSLNARNNFEGHSRLDKAHVFTWQPHGSQLTILRQISGSARAFEVKKPDAVDPQAHLAALGYTDDWVTFL